MVVVMVNRRSMPVLLLVVMSWNDMHVKGKGLGLQREQRQGQAGG